MPPYASADGLGPASAPGLSRLESATFTGEFPLAHIDFDDAAARCASRSKRSAPSSRLIPRAPGLPVAVLRYRVRNPGKNEATVSIAFSLDNPAGQSVRHPRGEQRRGPVQRISKSMADELQGLYMTNPRRPKRIPSAARSLCLLNPANGRVTYLRGWPAAKWWASPMLFWDDFTADGELGPEAAERKITGSLCLQREIAAGAEAEYTFLLGWHFPNRTPAWCGWTAPKGHENAIIGNHYCHAICRCLGRRRTTRPANFPSSKNAP